MSTEVMAAQAAGTTAPAEVTEAATQEAVEEAAMPQAVAEEVRAEAEKQAEVEGWPPPPELRSRSLEQKSVSTAQGPCPRHKPDPNYFPPPYWRY
jgi:hypothetical protein